MAIAKKSLLVLAAALATSLFSTATFAGYAPIVPVPVKAISLPPPPPPPVQVCIPIILVGTVCFTP